MKQEHMKFQKSLILPKCRTPKELAILLNLNMRELKKQGAEDFEIVWHNRKQQAILHVTKTG